MIHFLMYNVIFYGNLLSTKAHLVKAIVFPVVMCGGESWNIWKAERRIDAFELRVGEDS